MGKVVQSPTAVANSVEFGASQDSPLFYGRCMKAVVMPGSLLCGVCGGQLSLGGMPQAPHFLCPVTCQNLKCNDFNKVAMFPLMGLDLPNIEAAPSQIILPS
jgi:hypothetical protein